MSFTIIHPYQTFRDSTGKVRAGGFVTFFENTTTTKASIFSDESLTVAQTNPYELDSSGRIIGDVRFSGKLTMQEMNADGSDVITTDDVTTVGSNLSAVDTMADLLQATVPQSNVKLLGFHTIGDGGGGEFFYDTTALRTEHNGATIIDPLNPANLSTWDDTARTAWFAGGTGTGCWIRIYSNEVDVAWGGATVDQTDADNTDAINKLFAVMPADSLFLIPRNVDYTWTSISVGANQNVLDYSKNGGNGASPSSALFIDGSVDTEGVKFPATQVPSSDANTLDDYEEGTWTPTLGGTATYTTQSGVYTKIGRVVFFSCNLVINSIGTGSTTTISGLPFTSAARDFSLSMRNSAAIATSVVSLYPFVVGGTDTITIRSRITASVADFLNPIFANSTDVDIAGFYEV